MSDKPQGLHYNDFQNFNRHAATDIKGLTSKTRRNLYVQGLKPQRKWSFQGGEAS